MVVMTTSTGIHVELPSGSHLLKQPDIAYEPDESKYKARTACRLAKDPDLPKTILPNRFPRKVEGKIVWEGTDWSSEDQWVYQLSPAEVQEIGKALAHFKSK